MQLKTIYLFCFLMLPVVMRAQPPYPAEVRLALAQTSNRPALENALKYIYKTRDELAIQSINFLIGNMSIHLSHNYYWANEKGSRITYNESDYPTFRQAVDAFEAVKKKNGKLHPVAYTYRDIDSISSAMLIENVQLAVKKFRDRSVKESSADKGALDDFFEYILPYRTSIEPMQNWRKRYADKFAGLIKSNETPMAQALSIGQNIKSWFTNTYKIAGRDEPLLRLGALQLLSREKGACEDIAGLAAFMARSQGYAASVDYVPAWATASGLHYLDYINISPGIKHHYDAADGYVLDTLAREPAKVLRTTYSIQKQTIAAILKDSTQIPEGFMRVENYKDVTPEYWQTANVSSTLFTKMAVPAKAVFLAVWNFSKWTPVWYAEIKTPGQATFTNMCQGAVYLPVYYMNHKLVPAGWPVVQDFQFNAVLKPDLQKTRTIHLKEEAKYLAFRTGKRYALFYWNNRWVPLDYKKPVPGTTELIFDHVPADALLLLMPEYSQGKERPFIITANGQRKWY